MLRINNRLGEKVTDIEYDYEVGSRFQGGIKLKDLVYIDLQGLLIEVPGTGIEPAHPCERQILSLLRLPIPPPGLYLGWQYYCFSAKTR